MGKFSEQFKLSERIKNADFSEEKTRKFWTDWANGVIDKVVDGRKGRAEETKLLVDPIEKL
jgi:hypothetical protein